MVDTISNISSIATLILFIFYFIGRILTMNVEKSPGSERIIRCTFDDPDNLESYSTYDNDFKNKIVSSICLTEKSYEGCILFSSVPIKKVEIFPVCSRYKIFKINAKPYCKYNKPISPGYGILFQVGLPEGMPQYKAVITRFDYRKTVIYIMENCDNGILEFGYKTKHTLLSVLYYLTK